ncbi:major facilitator superfamily domain-containing protein [Xylariales sp. PMI_506]|nr:major facilitator superfamily domain-containing protein [Xylariales sp. PMI_506]
MISGDKNQKTHVPASNKDVEDGADPVEQPVPGQNIASTPAQTSANVEPEYPSGLKLALIVTSAFVSMFLVSLDRMITATAIPQITNDFNSITDIGWYASAYQLTTCAFQLLFGKIYTFFSIKTTYLTAIFLFELGSALSGAAPNSVAFIIGRAIAGVGGAGITSGMIMVIVYSVPLHKRPVFQGMMGSVFGIASVVGPLLGGAFTSKVSWRWCFYINLPFGAISMVFILFLLRIPDRDTTKLAIKEKLAQLDFYGTFLIIPGTTCLILALQWGGLTYLWSDGRIIALLVLAGLLLLGFVLVQIFLPKTATIAPRIFMQRSILAGFFCTICTGAHLMIFFYYLPLWFQAIQGLSAVDSGIRTIPILLSMVLASLSSGGIVQRIGYYTPLMIIGVCVMSVGAGLLTTLQLDTPTANLVGYQILYGVGLGLSSQGPNLAAQTVLPKPDIAIGAGLMFFSQLLSGAIFVSVGQNVLDNQLLNRLSSVPGFSPEMLLDSGATSLPNLPASFEPTFLQAYNESIRQLFRMGLILVCVSILGALAMEWRSVRKDKPAKEVNKTTEEDAKTTDGGSERHSNDLAMKDSRVDEKQSTADV